MKTWNDRVKVFTGVGVEWAVVSKKHSNCIELTANLTSLEWGKVCKLDREKEAMSRLFGGRPQKLTKLVTPMVGCTGCKSLEHEYGACPFETLKQLFEKQRARVEAGRVTK